MVHEDEIIRCRAFDGASIVNSGVGLVFDGRWRHARGMRILVAALFLAACGDGTVDTSSMSAWNDAVDAYVEATCTDLAPCTSEDPATCEADARDALDALRETLTAAERGDCVTCLEEMAQQNHDESFTCDPADVDQDALDAACGEANEACAGFP